jgi:hypothetical protein
MSVIRVGSSGMYAEGWDAIFGGATKRGSSSTAKKKSAAGATKTKTKPNKSAGSRKPAAKVGKRK